MKKIGASLASLMLTITLTSCSFDGAYRYECQDPAKWADAQCNPPICEATKTCSKDIVGEDTWTEYEKNKVNNG